MNDRRKQPNTELWQPPSKDTPELGPETVSQQQANTPVDDGPLSLVVNRYRIHAVLGEGGFGRVYRAVDEQLGREVAVKIPRLRASQAEEVEQFLAEARTLASMDHPAIVPVYDVGQTPDGTCYLVSKLIEGGDLAAKMQQGRPGHGETAELLATIAEALQYAHQRGLVHRDLKPSNVLLDHAGRPHVSDFGLALHEDQQRLHRDELAGTPAYMSPEQVRRESHRLDGRTDLWSLGVIMYEMLTGRCPFHGQVHDIFDDILHREPKPLRQIDGTISPELERICLKCLSKDLSGRYTAAADLAVDLRQAAAGLRGTTPRDGSSRKQTTILPIAASLAAAALLVLACFGGMSFWQRWPSDANVAGPASHAVRGKPDAVPPDRESSPPESSVAAASASDAFATEEIIRAAPPRSTPTGPDLSLERARAAAASFGLEQRVTIEMAQDAASCQTVGEGAQLAHFAGHAGPVNCLAFSMDGKWLASGASDQTVRVWDLASWKLQATIRGFPAAVHAVAFSPDRRLLAWSGDGYYDMLVHVWDFRTNTLYATFRWHEQQSPSRVHALAFSPDGKLLAAGGSGAVRVWDVEARQDKYVLEWQHTFPSYVYCVAFSPDTRLLAAGCHGGAGGVSQAECVRLWDVESAELSEMLIGDSDAFGLSHDDVRGAVAFSGDGAFVGRITKGGSRDFRSFGSSPGGSVMIWRLTDRAARTWQAGGGSAFALSMLASDRLLVAGSQGAGRQMPTPFADNTAPDEVHLTTGQWEHAGAEARRATGHRGAVLSLAISADQRLLASGGQENGIKIWNVASLLVD